MAGAHLSKSSMRQRALLRLFALEYGRLPALMLLAVLFWFSSLSQYAISIDQEFAAFQAGPLWWVSQGRWLTHLLSRYVLPQPVIPYLPHLILCASLAVSYLLLLKAHGLRCNRRALLLFPVFMAFPTWFYIGEFYANLLSVSAGVLLCALAALVFAQALRAHDAGRLRTLPLLGSLALCSVLVGTALGAYQSYLPAFAGMALGTALLRGPAAADARPPILWKRLLVLLVVVAGAALFYLLVSTAFKALLDTREEYVGAFMKLQVLIAHPLPVILGTLEEALHFYAGRPRLFGVSLAACGLLVVTGLAGAATQGQGMARRAATVLLALACLAAPFSLNLLAGGAYFMPYRSLVAAPYAVWLLAALALYARQAWLRHASVLLLAAAAFQLLNAHASYSAARSLALAHDRDLAAAIYARIVETAPGLQRDAAQKVDFHGAKPFSSPFPTPFSSTIGRSFFEWDGGNPVRIHYFMKLLGYEGLQLVSSGERNALQDAYTHMPSWPAQGAVRRVGDTVLVKLGPERGVEYEAHLRLIDGD